MINAQEAGAYTRAVILRGATSDDVRAVLELWAVAAEDAHRPPDSAAALRALLARDPDALILAVEQDIIVGTVIAGWDGWRCHLYRLAVAPDRRRTGIGRMLVRAAEERFVALGGTRVDAMVLDENELAHHAWRAAGYTRQEEWSRWVKPLPTPRD
ncbi:GNAT family N-acetyltransferase [Micromonospora zhanjiangensis]|uniref:GNAT family N-acetyltransferase n=1 Tax=Micromonospora zhanjiangensis TaxID=1522057 RepID=A0ABV8KEM8_9ACTN